MTSNGDRGAFIKELKESLSLSEEGATSCGVLLDLQDEHDDLFEQYSKERRALEDKYANKFGPLYTKRSAELEKATIPQFWVTAFLNCEMIAENITEKDQSALRFLRDVTAQEVSTADAEASLESSKLTAGSFTLTFFFDENPFFENKTLSKTYVMQADDDEELQEVIGCDIKWKAGKDLTHRMMRKKTRGSRGGTGKVVTKKEPRDTFFNFFTPPPLPKESDLEGEELDVLDDCITADFELGDTIRSDVIPRAVLYFSDEVENDGLQEDDEGDVEVDEDGNGEEESI